MRIFRHWKAVGFLAFFVLINGILCFLLEPWNGASEGMWKGYYKQEKLDMIFVGSSVCQQTFIPDVFDENMGVNSYNMGTPSQAIPQTLRTIQVAEQDHDVKKVVFGMGFSSFKYNPIPEAELTFESARVRQKGGVKGVLDTLSYIFSKKVIKTENSINFLFPWVYNCENYMFETISENITYKIRRWKTKEFTYPSIKGYRNNDTRVFDYNNRWVTNTNQFYEPYFSAKMLEEFEELLKYCKEKEIELIIVNTPHPIFDVVTCEAYYNDNQEQFLEYCDKYDAKYYDFSLAKPEIFENKLEYFCDYEHLNKQGSEVFCQNLSKFLIEESKGTDMSQYFYSIDEFYELHSDELKAWKEWNE